MAMKEVFEFNLLDAKSQEKMMYELFNSKEKYILLLFTDAFAERLIIKTINERITDNHCIINSKTNKHDNNREYDKYFYVGNIEDNNHDISSVLSLKYNATIVKYEIKFEEDLQCIVNKSEFTHVVPINEQTEKSFIKKKSNSKVVNNIKESLRGYNVLFIEEMNVELIKEIKTITENVIISDDIEILDVIPDLYILKSKKSKEVDIQTSDSLCSLLSQGVKFICDSTWSPYFVQICVSNNVKYEASYIFNKNDAARNAS